MVVRSVASEGGALFVGVGFAVGVDVGMNRCVDDHFFTSPSFSNRRTILFVNKKKKHGHTTSNKARLPSFPTN